MLAAQSASLFDPGWARLARNWLSGRPRHEALRRNHAFFARLDHDRTLEDCGFAVIDAELTGLNPRHDAIVSLAGVRVRSMRIDPADAFCSLARPGRDLPKGSTLIHRITSAQAEAAPDLELVLAAFVDWLGDSLIVAHHASMDMAFVNRAARRCWGGMLLTPCVDTLRLAQAFKEESWSTGYERYDASVSYNLADLAQEYGLPRFRSHDALQDALQAAYLFLFLARKLDQGRVRTLGDLHRAGRRRRLC